MSAAMLPSTGSSSWTPKLILLFNLLENLVFLTACSGDLVFFKDPIGAIFTPQYGTKLAIAGYALIGVPVIFAGFTGVMTRSEKLVRAYFFYMLLCVFLFAAYVTETVVEYMPCGSGTNLEGSKEGPCGPFRGLEISGLALAAGIHLCLVHPMWSFTQELRCESASPVFAVTTEKEKMESKRQAFQRLREGPLSSIQGRLVGEYGSLFEAAAGMSYSWRTQSSQFSQQPPHLPNLRLV